MTWDMGLGQLAITRSRPRRGATSGSAGGANPRKKLPMAVPDFGDRAAQSSSATVASFRTWRGSRAELAHGPKSDPPFYRRFASAAPAWGGGSPSRREHQRGARRIRRAGAAPVNGSGAAALQ